MNTKIVGECDQPLFQFNLASFLKDNHNYCNYYVERVLAAAFVRMLWEYRVVGRC